MAKPKNSGVKSYTVTKEHFKMYDKYVRSWVDRLGLGNWHITMRYGKSEFPEMQRSLTYVEYSYATLEACIGISKCWRFRVTKRALEQAAFHEAMHLLLAPIFESFDLLRSGKIMALSCVEEHQIIASLERALFARKRKTDSNKTV